MKKILVILTGGTIGSKSEEHVLDVGAASCFELIRLYQKHYETEGNRTVEFETRSPYQILSENITPNEWNKLLDCLKTVDQKNYDGIIITHGSDTLSYTAALFGMLFADIQIPLVFIAANYELSSPKGNGLTNFKAAVDFISSEQVPGVFCIYQNKDTSMPVYLATRMMEADTIEDQYRVYGGEYFGWIKDEKFLPAQSKIQPTKKELKEQAAKRAGSLDLLRNSVQFTNEVLVIHPYPGLNYRYLSPDASVKAILHLGYHSATACCEGDALALPQFMKRCDSLKIPVYLGAFKKEADIYQSSDSLLNLGIKPLFQMSPEAAYAKLLLAYNQSCMPVDKFLKYNLFYEEIDSII